MGGHATWSMAERYPQRFAAIAPVAGAGNPQSVATLLRQTPAWVFHGATDPVVPVSYGQAMVDAFVAAGVQVKATIYPDRGHDVWDLPFRGPELYEWFLQHSRGRAARQADQRVQNP
jgi:predicted peptidase